MTDAAGACHQAEAAGQAIQRDQPLGPLPVGVQVVGRKWQEMALLNTAKQLATCTGGCQSPDHTA
jgi:hypothetical protein